jgi:hypothetical protein
MTRMLLEVLPSPRWVRLTSAELLCMELGLSENRNQGLF